MKINKKNLSLVGLLILFSVAYLLLSTKPAKNALQLVPQWSIDINSAQVSPTNSEVKPFKLGQQIGYYTPEGTIASLHTLQDRGSISSHFFAPFSSNAADVVFFTQRSEQSGVLEKAGFPFFEGDRIFLFSPSGNSFSSHSSDGSEKWFYEDYAPITTFYSNEEGIVVGFADGKVMVFNSDGSIRQDFYPGGSEYEIVFGSSLSPSGRYVACLSGLDMQRIIITDIEGNTSKIIFHEYIENAVIEQSLVYFSTNEQYVFANVKDGLVVIDIKEKSDIHIPIEGKVVTIKEVQDGNYYFVLSKNRNESTITIFNDNMFEVGSFVYEEQNSFIDSDEEYVYIGNGSVISKMYVE